jgi:hypothetical protein
MKHRSQSLSGFYGRDAKIRNSKVRASSEDPLPRLSTNRMRLHQARQNSTRIERDYQWKAYEIVL